MKRSLFLFSIILVLNNCFAQSIIINNNNPNFAWVGELVATTDPMNPQYSYSYSSLEIIMPGTTVSFTNPTQLTNPQSYLPGVIFSTSDIFIGMKGGMYDAQTMIPIQNADATVGSFGTYLGYPNSQSGPSGTFPPLYFIFWTQNGNDIIVNIF